MNDFMFARLCKGRSCDSIVVAVDGCLNVVEVNAGMEDLPG